jgi:hypothetical protein
MKCPRPGFPLTSTLVTSKTIENSRGSVMSKLAGIQESVTVRVADPARKLERSGKRIIKLQTGDADFPTPEPIVDEPYAAMKKGAIIALTAEACRNSVRRLPISSLGRTTSATVPSTKYSGLTGACTGYSPAFRRRWTMTMRS